LIPRCGEWIAGHSISKIDLQNRIPKTTRTELSTNRMYENTDIDQI
jgi:hypothetical protein